MIIPLSDVMDAVVRLQKARAMRRRRASVAECRTQNRAWLKRRRPKMCVRPGTICYQI